MPRTLVVHTGETLSFDVLLATVVANNTRPHWISDPEHDRLEQLIPLDQPARTLRNAPGGVETNNRGGVLQVEVCGHAEDIPFYSDRWYETFARHLVMMCEAGGVPPVFPYAFRPYPASYGLLASQRLTSLEWLEVEGIVGHQHVPENDHGDPGGIHRVMPLVAALTDPNPDDGDDDMPRTQQEHFTTSMDAVERLYSAYRNDPVAYPWLVMAPDAIVTDLQAWARSLADNIFRIGQDGTPDVRFLALWFRDMALAGPPEA